MFGLTRNDYEKGRRQFLGERTVLFRELRKETNPQALVCFGKDHWGDFEDIFMDHKDNGVEHQECKVSIYEKDRVILTGHFSRGSAFPKIAVDLVAETLSKWGVQVPY